MLGLLDVATSMVRVVLLRPPEGVGALGVGLAELAAAALRHTLDAQGDGAIAVHIVHSPEAELLGWAAAQLDGCRAREGHEVGPADVTKLELHLGQEAPGLVQVGVVTPLVLRPVPLPRTLATPSSVRVVDQPEASRAVPGQAGEEPGVAGHIAVLRAVGWPVGPGRCHQRRNLPIEPRNVQRLQLAMVLRLAHDLGSRVGAPQGGQVLPGWDGALVVVGEVVAAHLRCRGKHGPTKETHGAKHLCFPLLSSSISQLLFLALST
mmetsp:Transcript_31268/g.74607  ORF Transcript_31268/g.74607 Transcript_31268/m.74607 type:complete len:264 (-) Transcript_31268:2-793(-)